MISYVIITIIQSGRLYYHYYHISLLLSHVCKHGLITHGMYTSNPYHCKMINTLRLRQNCRHFADDIFKCIFLNEKAWILLMMSLKFVPQVWINSIRALVQIMARHRPGDKPLSEPMVISLPTHICVNQSQWVNINNFDIPRKILLEISSDLYF